MKEIQDNVREDIQSLMQQQIQDIIFKGINSIKHTEEFTIVYNKIYFPVPQHIKEAIM